jgi:hypothetical protein
MFSPKEIVGFWGNRIFPWGICISFRKSHFSLGILCLCVWLGGVGGCVSWRELVTVAGTKAIGLHGLCSAELGADTTGIPQAIAVPAHPVVSAPSSAEHKPCKPIAFVPATVTSSLHDTHPPTPPNQTQRHKIPREKCDFLKLIQIPQGKIRFPQKPTISLGENMIS